MIEVDFNKREYREGIIFFGFRFGEWKKIPPIEYVSIVSQNIVSTSNRNSGFLKPTILSSNTEDTYYGTVKIRLFQSYRVKINLKEVNSVKRALKLGKTLANGLKVPLLNATIKPAEFVDV